MKRFYSLMAAVVLMAVGCVNAMADDVTATLTKTWSVQGGSNAAGVFTDAETHYYNNWGTTAWVAQAYAEFEMPTLPEGATVTAATFTVNVNCGRGTRTFDVNYLPANSSADDYQVLVAKTGTSLASYSDITTAYAKKVIDAKAAVQAMIAGKSSNLIIIMSNGAAGGNIYGKGSEANAPTLTITYTTEATTSYTIKYVDEDGESIKDDVTVNNIAVGTNVTASASDMTDIYGSTKYIYKEGNEEITTTNNAADNVITLIYRKANGIRYTVSTSMGSQLNCGENYEGESVTTVFWQYIPVKGILYSANAINKEYNYTFTLSEETKDAVINYTKTDTRVVYYSEAEDIYGMTANAGGNANIRCSGSKGGYAESDVNVVTLPAGSYKLTAQVWGNTGVDFTFKAGDKTILTAPTKGYIISYTSDEFELTEPTDIIIPTNGSNGKVIDWVYIEQTAVVRDTETGKYGTICVPNVATATGASVYTAAISAGGESVELTEVAGEMEAGVAYIYQATAETQKFAYSGVPVETPSKEGVLKGVFEETDAPVDSYVLQTQEDVQAFYKVGATAAVSVPANKAYLTVPTSDAKMITIGEDSEATAIKAINALTTGNAKIYDLNGRELKSLQKGVNIVNGVKVYVK